MSDSVDPGANLAALARSLPPDLAAYLASAPATQSSLTGSAGAWNIDLGGSALYPGGAEAYAQGQVDAFRANPVRRISYAVSNFLFSPDQTDAEGRFMPRPLDGEGLAQRLTAENPDSIAAGFAGSLLRHTDGAELDWFPDPGAGHLIVFGLGLGLHVPMLVDALDVRDVVIVDPYPEFLLHSLSAVDWAGLVAVLNRRGGALTFLFGNEAPVLAAGVQEVMRRAQYARIDGAYMFEHYQAAPLPDTIRQVQERGPLMELSKGFFEDELRMMSQTVWNLAAGTGRYLDPRRENRSGCPAAVILGSGPSADRGIPHVERLVRQGAALFTVGTGLSVALEHGLTPDCHFEIENEGTILDGLDALTDKFDLKRVALFGSWTVAPSNVAYFGSATFYFRDTNSGTRLFADPDEAVYLSGPTVANLACRFAIAVGIPAAYLFGVDLGSRDPEVHHSQRSLYSTLDSEFWQTGRGMDLLEIEAPANLGGTAYTSRQFLLTRTTFEGLFRYFSGTRFYNCSDGILLPGAEPLPPETANLPPGTAGTVFSADDFAVPYRTSDFADRLDGFKQALDAWHRDFNDVLAGCGDDLDRLIDGTLPLIRLADDSRSHGADAAVHVTFSGSLLSMMQMAYALHRRLPEARRPEFMRLAVREMGEWVDGAVRRARDLADAVSNDTERERS